MRVSLDLRKYAGRVRQHLAGGIIGNSDTKTCSIKWRLAGGGTAGRSLRKIKEICFSGLASVFTIGFLEPDYAAISYISGRPLCN